MQDIQSASLTKERILSVIRARGPSLPIPLAKAVNISPLFASAFLSELFGERKIRISNMRVGSSPLYYIEGQEPQLENYIEYLNHKEKEAFSLLKQSKLLDDEGQHPAIRVALRGMKDFAIQTKLNIDDKEKIFWRYFLLPESEIEPLINPKKQIKEEKPLEKIKENINQIESVIKREETKKEETEIKYDEASKEQPSEIVKSKEKKRPVKELKTEDQKFAESIKKYLTSREIEIVESIDIKKKEFIAKVRLDAAFGKQEYYLIAKEKKKITEEELTMAFHKAQENKMPALLIAPGEIDKKAQQFMSNWRNLIKFEKLKL